MAGRFVTRACPFLLAAKNLTPGLEGTESGDHNLGMLRRSLALTAPRNAVRLKKGLPPIYLRACDAAAVAWLGMLGRRCVYCGRIHYFGAPGSWCTRCTCTLQPTSNQQPQPRRRETMP